MAILIKKLVTKEDIAELRRLLAGTSAHVRSPSDNGYDESVKRWSKAAEKRAGVAVVPTTSEEVAIAVKYASERNLELAVKGGGHSTSGASSTQGGLLIDLGRMRGVRVDKDKSLLYIQGGALWADVDAEAYKYGLATVGGTVADTGVGGLTLGGGYGNLSGSYGLVIDNTVAFTTVLADGSIQNITKESNPDLFWAMNGSGQNFGVTTEFVLKAYPQGEMYMGLLIFDSSPETIKNLVAAVNELWSSSENQRCKVQGRASGLLIFGRPPDAGGQTMIMLITVVNDTEENAKELLKPILDVGPVANLMKMDEYPACNKLAPGMYGLRSSMKGSSSLMPLHHDFVAEVGSAFGKFMDTCDDAAPSLVAFELYDPYEVAKRDNGCFANRGFHLNSLIMPLWTKAENDKRCRQFARDMSNMFKKEIERNGKRTGAGLESGAGVRGSKGAVMLYGNYDQYEEESKDIFGDHYERLQDLKARYDPNSMFDKLFAIVPESPVSPTV